MPVAAYPHLARPGTIGRLHVACRVLMGSMHLGLEGPGADVEALTAFYAERARGGAALLVTGGVAVAAEGGGDHYFVITEPDQRAALAALAGAVHRAGAPIAMQLFHAGRYARAEETGLQPVSASAIPSRFQAAPPRALREGEVAGVVGAFAAAGAFAAELGFDAVEVMGSEGYLLNQFFSPLTNRRDDRWGGDLDGRMRLPRAVVSALRRDLGADFPIIYRLSGDDLMPGSSTPAETAALARALVAAGADALSVGVGWHESAVPTVGVLVPRASFAPVAARVRAAVDGAVPVIASNRINTPEVAEAVLAAGQADFVALARPFLADSAFAAKALRGERERINVCVACNQACLDAVLGVPPRPVGCMVNPAAAHEREMVLRPAAPGRRLAVVGAGPAGLEAARVLGARGVAVTLFERERQLGGQLRLAASIPGKQEFLETLRYYAAELCRLGVRIETGVDPLPSDLAGFEAAVAATGVRPRIPDIPGVELPHVATYADILGGRVRAGRRVAVIGAGGVACDVAHFLTEPHAPGVEGFWAEYGGGPAPVAVREVTLLRRGRVVGERLGRTTRWALLAALRRRGVQMRTGVAYEAIVPEGILLRGGELVAADSVVLACGQEPVVPFAGEIPLPLYTIGGARDARELDACRAIAEGSRLAAGM